MQPLTKCKCGRRTSFGLLCVLCSLTFDNIEKAGSLSDEEEAGFFIDEQSDVEED